jgi:uncharacterized protein YdeI (YjbR/CyaY-like superfamily)
MIKTETFIKIEVTSASQLRDWLIQNFRQMDSVWLVTYKKHISTKYVSTSDVLDELLCFGWIDGLRRKLDEDRTLQLISPRQTLHWAESYKLRADRLIESGKMNDAGLTSIKASKLAGLWNAMDDVDALKIPDDLAIEMDKHPNTAQQFSALAVSYRRNILRWLMGAKTPPTRQKRIKEITLATASKKRIAQL